MHSRFVQIALLLLFMVSFCSIGVTQTETATLTGTVTDPTGAVVPNAQVTVTNIAMGTVTDRHQQDRSLYRSVPETGTL